MKRTQKTLAEKNNYKYKGVENPALAKGMRDIAYSGAWGTHKQHDPTHDLMSEVEEELSEMGYANVKVNF